RLNELALAPDDASHLRLWTVPATDFARNRLGRALPNAALLGAFAALTGAVSLESVARAIRDRFSGSVGDGNAAAAQDAYEDVSHRMSAHRGRGVPAGASARARAAPHDH